MSTHITLNPSITLPTFNGDGNDLKLSLALIRVTSYSELRAFYLNPAKPNTEGNIRSPQVLRNQSSHINTWITYHKLTDSSPVGEELVINFHQQLAGYITYLEELGKVTQTIQDRKSTIISLRESYLELACANGPIGNFAEALATLIKISGKTINEVAKAIKVAWGTIADWSENRCIPMSSSIKHVHCLEDYFQVARGTLSSKLNEALWRRGKVYRTCTTDWRNYQSEMIKLEYVLKNLPPNCQGEWDRLVHFFTDPMWTRRQGLEQNSEWRIRWNRRYSPTALLKNELLRRFFGYLCLPLDAQDLRMRGKGFEQSNLTLALLSDADLVFDYLAFSKERAFTKAHNTSTSAFLSFCTQLLLKGTGYLWQHPEFGKKLTQYVPTDKWHAWCEKNWNELIKIKRTISKSKKDNFKKTHDPFEGVREFIEERQHPITVMWGLAKSMEMLTPFLEKGSKERLALHWRDLFLIKFITSNPLRVENLSMMTYIPKNWDDLCYRPDSLYIETERSSNFYQKSDGSWWVRFNPEDFKNEEGTASDPYDVPVVQSARATLEQYLFDQRPIINQALTETISKLRLKGNLPPLTEKEILAVEQCHYVLRPSKFIVYTLSAQRNETYQGIEPVTNKSIGQTMRKWTQKYIPGCRGFSTHAVRHLVATEYIKNNPNGVPAAAAALHDSQITVSRDYAWVTPNDKIKPWNEYYEELRKQHEKGDI